MEVFVELAPKVETGQDSPLSCRFCLAPESTARLTRRDLTAFYVVFNDCGLGLNITEETHYNWVCAYCWARAAQCVRFVECARRAEHVLTNVLQHEVVTEERLNSICASYITRPVQLSACTSWTEWESDPANYDLCVVVSQSAPCGRAANAEPASELEYYDDRADLEDLHAYSNDKTVDDSRIGKEKRATRKINRITKDPKTKQPRKDPDELVAKWRELEVEVVNLTEAQQRRELEERRRTPRYLAWKYKCDKCAVGFHEEECIDKHNEAHAESRGPYECNVCHVRFANQHQLSSHGGGHRRRWRCLRCGETIANSAYLAPHHAKCTGSAPVTCDQCGKFYSNELRLRKHVSKSHNAKSKYMCDVCGRAFKEKQQIKYHMRVHTRETPFSCAICGKRSATSTSHRLHMMVHISADVKSPETYCVECDRYFKNKYILRSHFKQSLKHVSKDTFRHGCSECEERFPGASALRVHMNTCHLKLRTHPCAACDKAYYTQGALTAHVREKHVAGERSKHHLCTVCTRTFMTSSQLKAHSRSHTKERPYACLLCPATFSFNSALYTHNKLKHKMTTAELRSKLGVKKA